MYELSPQMLRLWRIVFAVPGIMAGHLAVESTAASRIRLRPALVRDLDHRRQRLRRVAAAIGHDSSPRPSGNPLTRVICRDLPRLFRKHFGGRLCAA